MNLPGLVLGGLGGALLGAGVWLTLRLLVGALPDRTPTSTSTALSLEGVTRARLLRVAGVVAAGAVVWVLTGWPVAAILVAVATWWLPRLLGPDHEHTVQVAQVEAVAGWAEQIRDLMAGAAGLHQAIAHTVPTAPAPIRADVAHLADQLQHGVPPEDALRAFAMRVDVPTADLVVAALSGAATRQAADLGGLLSSLAQAAREQAAMLVRVAATRARVRTSARIITGTTLGMAAILALINANYLAAYDTGTGQVVLGVIGALWAVGMVWLARLARTDLGPRVLAREHPKTASEVDA
ncbi:type II secretion system F family protein [Nocardiopsis synnemataformans]|uniref:type II secretion system F family protein n=1 Tax=Nocardiopsis synnemataformans TaxID=61305 RepID=UPI003EB8B448